MSNQENILKAHNAIKQAKMAIKKGNRFEARLYAYQAAQHAPDLELPWLLLASLSSPQTSITYASRALEINPSSRQARAAIHWALKTQRSGSGLSTSNNQSKIQIKRPNQVDSHQKTEVITTFPPQTTQQKKISHSKTMKKTTAGPFWRPILILGGINLSLLCLVGLILLFSQSGTYTALANAMPPSATPGLVDPVMANFALIENQTTVPGNDSLPPTQTPTPLQANTLTLTNTPTLTGTQTPSVTPSVTPSLTITYTLIPPTNTVPPPEPDYNPTPEEVITTINLPYGVDEQDYWVDVDLEDQRLNAYQGMNLQNSFVVSTGAPDTPTVTGIYNVYVKYPSLHMRGSGYDYPDVKYQIYFYKDYGIHSAYWHNDFGTPVSHGCVNMRVEDAEWLYGWAGVGTTIYIHY